MSEKEDTERTKDLISEQDQEIAENALTEFKKKNYVACLQHLNKLDNRSNDFKVAHNKAVLEFCKNDFKKTDAFLEKLKSICSQFLIKMDTLEDLGYCVIHFNHAIILYHQHKYTEAVRVMDKVYKFIEPMDDSLAKQVSLLAIELQLYLRQPEKALSLISYLENQLLRIGNIPSVKSPDKNAKEKEKKNQQTTQQINDPAVEEFRKKLRKYKVRCHLMNRALNHAKAELQIMNATKGNIDGLFMMANYEYLRGNYNQAIEVLCSIPKDCLVFSEHGESSTVMFYNNMGVIHHAMGKHNLARYYFQQALKEDMAITSEVKVQSEKPLYTLGGSRFHELMYNLGIATLHAGKPAQAFECLIIAVRRYHKNCRLWLRLAECCIRVHKRSNEVDFDFLKKQKEMIVDIVGSKDKQKVILNTNLSKDKKYSPESQSYAVPVPSLEFAKICIQNARVLLPASAPSEAVPLLLVPGGIPPPSPSPAPGPAPSPPLGNDTATALRNAVLCAGAYVHLCIGDYVIALGMAKELLAQPRLAGGHRLLGHLYAAECLVLLDQIPTAMEHLNPEIIKDIDFALPTSPSISIDTEVLKATPPAEEWCPNNISSAHAVMHYNLAVCKAIRGQFDQALDLLKAVWQAHVPNTVQVPAHIIMLVIYLELRKGYVERARQLIKQYSFQHRLSSNG